MDTNRQKKEIAEIYLSILKKNIHPFENSVSRSDIRSHADRVDIVRPHQRLDHKFLRMKKTVQEARISKLQPILGEAGSGKTHYYWILKDQEKSKPESKEYDFRTIYVPSPPMPIRIPLHILTCVLDEQGIDIIGQTAKNLVSHFQKTPQDSMDTLKGRMIGYFGGIYSEIIRVLLLYSWLDTPENVKKLCERWLFADALEESELAQLKVKNSIKNDQDAFGLLRIFDEFNGAPLVYFFDEMELLNRIHGSEAEIRLWEIIKKMFNESHNSLFFTTCLLTVWDRVQSSLDASIISRFEPEITLSAFSLEETARLNKKLMTQFWKSHFLKSPPNPFFPLNEHINKVIFQKSQGNPRKYLNLIGQIIDKIIIGEVEPTSISEDASPEEISKFLTRYTDKDPLSTDYVPMKEDFIHSSELRKKQEPCSNELLTPVLQQNQEKARIIVEEEVYFVKITPTAIVSSLKSFFSNLKNYGNDYDFHISGIEFNYSFSIQNRPKLIPLYVKIGKTNPTTIGFEIPFIKDFRAVSKAKTYFSIMECASYINRNIFQKVLLILPPNLFHQNSSLARQLIHFTGELKILELNEEEARSIVEKGQPSRFHEFLDLPKVQEIIQFCFPDLDSDHYKQLREFFTAAKEKNPTTKIKLENDNFNEFLLKINEQI
ncbi:MAG: hypothetical protein ACTSRK_08120 [Promethearchaeota archaeon]